MRLRHPPRGSHGLMLAECLVYIAVWFVIVGLGFTLYYRLQTSTRVLQRSVEDIGRALRAGERWRADLRLATTAPTREAAPDFPGGAVRIPQATGEVWYGFTGSNVVRRVGATGPWTPALERVAASEMVRRTSGDVVAWCWEVELAVKARVPSLVPQFTFQVVPGRSP